MIDFLVPLEPVAKGRARFSRRGHAFTPAKTRRFERDFARLASKHKPASPLEGPLQMVVLFTMRAPKRNKRALPYCRPDLDNLIKAIKDAMNEVFWLDDAQVVCLYARKEYGTPSIRVSIAKVSHG